MDIDNIATDALTNHSVHGLFSRRFACGFQPDSYADFNMHRDIQEVFKGWTQKNQGMGLDVSRLWSLYLNIDELLARTNGQLAELGVYKGNSASLFNFFSKKYQRRLYLMDTFQGFPEGEVDDAENKAKIAAFVDTSLEAVQSMLGENPLLRFLVGIFPDTATDEIKREQFSAVSLDADNYKPILAGLEFFFPRMEQGGYIFVHDYGSGHWPGVKEAINHYFGAPKPLGSFLLPDKAGTLVIQKT